MPWTNDNLDLLVSQARKILLNEFPDLFTAQIYVCTQLEMIERIKKEVKREEFKSGIKKYLARFIIGKYFAVENIIWLVEGKGENLPTLIHELLHSIQECSPHRENIVNFLVYKMLDNTDFIDQKVLKEWIEIQKTVSYKEIKERLLSEGDCEDF